MADFLFISDDALPGDSELFFGEIQSHEKLVVFDKTTFTMADMVVVAKLQPSRGQARKNGWLIEPVPLGFGMRKSGKNRIFWFNSMDQILA